MPIQTATLEQCVSGLKRTIDSQAATIEHQARQLQDARAWAALWKRAAKKHRRLLLMVSSADARIFQMVVRQNAETNAVCQEIERQAAEIERLRGLLKAVEWVRDENLPEWDQWCPWCKNERCDGHLPDCPGLEAIAKAEMEEADHDAR